MNKYLSKYFFYYPVTLLKGEFVVPYLKRYKEFQYKSHSEIEQYQLEKLNHITSYAYKNVPYYKKSWGLAFSESPVFNKLTDIQKLPFLEKQTLNENASQLKAEIASYKVTAKTTGGSTGQAVTIYKNVDALARERAATWRAYAWAGVDIGDPQARFWGVPINTGSRLKYTLVDIVANRKRLSAFNTSDAVLNDYYKQLHRFRPRYLYGYVSVIELFIQYLRRHNLLLPESVTSIITTSEVLTDNIRSEVESYTGLKIFNEYGCGEVGSIAHECSHGNMHLMSDNLVVEVLDEEGRPSNIGEIVVTDLFNRAMPLVRYRLSDYAEINYGECGCGVKLPMVKKVFGRAYDMIIKPDGSKAHPELIMYIFEEIKENIAGIEQFQLIQDKINHFTINLVLSDKAQDMDMYQSLLTKKIDQELKSTYQYSFNKVSQIEREKSGKIRLIKSLLG